MRSQAGATIDSIKIKPKSKTAHGAQLYRYPTTRQKYFNLLTVTTGLGSDTVNKIFECKFANIFLPISFNICRVPTRQGKVREVCFFFKVREKSGNSVKWSGKLENLQKSGKSQGILKSCLVNPSKIKQTNMR